MIRPLVTIRSSLLLTIIHQCTKRYNYLQAYLQKLQTYTNTFTNTKVIKNAKLIIGLGWIKLFMMFGHNEITSHFSLTFYKVSFLDTNRCPIKQITSVKCFTIEVPECLTSNSSFQFFPQPQKMLSPILGPVPHNILQP